jgi:peptidoglycan/xylan/chitin deacetylase (PgdA/CDA1 family)
MRPFLKGVLQKKEPSGRQLFLTFDDGLEGFYHHVFPILEELGASATVFLVTGHVGGRADWYPKESGGVVPPLPMLNWAQIREMHQCGIDFQAHTHTHPHLTEIPLKDAVEEALRSKKTIEDGIGREVSLFCYPNGKFSSEIASAIRDCGFQAAVTTEPGMYRSGDDPFSIKRLGHDLIRVDDRVTARLVSRMLLHGTFPSYVAFKRFLRKRGWISAPFQLSNRETPST